MSSTIEEDHRDRPASRSRGHPGRLAAGVLRIETSDREATTPIILDMLRSVYPHEQVFGEYCTVHGSAT